MTRWSSMANLGGTFLFALLLGSVQTVLWPLFFGSIIAPLFWLNLMLYLMIYRTPGYAVFSVYVFGFLFCSFSAVPPGVMLSTIMTMFLIVNFLKSRVFWTGFSYFAIVSALGAVAYHTVFFFISLMIEKNTAGFLVVDRIVQILLTPSVAYPIYAVMQRLDNATLDQHVIQSGGLEA